MQSYLDIVQWEFDAIKEKHKGIIHEVADLNEVLHIACE